MKKTSVNNLEIYEEAFKLTNLIWNCVKSWSIFSRDTLGKQLVRSGDSVVLNIAEGFGRFNYRENRQFCFYARGSLQETKTALHLAKERLLIQESEYEILQQGYDILGKRLNNYIKSINSKILKENASKEALLIDKTTKN